MTQEQRRSELKNIVTQIRSKGAGFVSTNIDFDTLNEIGFGYLTVRRGDCKSKNRALYIANPTDKTGLVNYMRF